MRQVPGAAWAAFVSSPELALAAGASVSFFLAVLLVAISRHLGRRKQQTPSAVVDLQVDTGPATAVEEVTDVRVLHAHIRILEEALEQETALVREPAPTPEAIRKEAVDELHRRIRSTVHGLGVRMEDDPAAVLVLARVEAAVNRLMPPAAQFVRPTLTVARHVERLPTEVPSADPVRQFAGEDAVPEVPNPTVPPAAPSPATPVGEEAVLPIPARTPSPEIRRGRRWLHGSAA